MVRVGKGRGAGSGQTGSRVPVDRPLDRSLDRKDDDNPTKYFSEPTLRKYYRNRHLGVGVDGKISSAAHQGTVPDAALVRPQEWWSLERDVG